MEKSPRTNDVKQEHKPKEVKPQRFIFRKYKPKRFGTNASSRNDRRD